MVTRDEIVELLTGKYSDMELSYNSGGYEFVGNDLVSISLSPESSVQSSLRNMKRTLAGRIMDNFEVESVDIEGSTNLDEYQDLFRFSKFIDQEIEERNLDRSSYGLGSKITKTLDMGEELNKDELLGVVGSVMDTEKLFAGIYEKNEKNSLSDYKKSKNLFYRSQVL